MTRGKKIIRSFEIAFFLIPVALIIEFINEIPYLYEEASNIQRVTRALEILYPFSKSWIIPNQQFIWLAAFILTGILLLAVWFRPDAFEQSINKLSKPFNYIYLAMWLISLIFVSKELWILLVPPYIDGVWKLKGKPFIRKAALFFAYGFLTMWFISSLFFPDIGDHGLSPYTFIFGLPALFFYSLSLVIAIALYYGKHIVTEHKKIRDGESDLIKMSSKSIGMFGPIVWAIYILILTFNYELLRAYQVGYNTVMIITVSTIIGIAGAANANLKLLAVSLIGILTASVWLTEDIAKYLTIIVVPPMLIFLASAITLYASSIRNRKDSDLSSI